MERTAMDPATHGRPYLTEVLGSMLGTVSFRAEVFFRGQMCDEWSIDTSGSNLVSFHAIGGGECWLHLRSLPEPKPLRRGDVVVLPLDHQHAITSGRDSTPAYGAKRYSKVCWPWTRLPPAPSCCAATCRCPGPHAS